MDLGLGAVVCEVGSVRFHSETTPIGRFIPLNPRDGAEMAFPGVFWATKRGRGGRNPQRLSGMPTDRSMAHSTEVALTATGRS
jgi:hypothetical protein